jgi:hypothetical protein
LSAWTRASLGGSLTGRASPSTTENLSARIGGKTFSRSGDLSPRYLGIPSRFSHSLGSCGLGSSTGSACAESLHNALCGCFGLGYSHLS